MAEKMKDPFVEHVKDEFERYEKFHQDRFSKDEKIYNMWNNKPPTKSLEWMNAINVPLMVEGEQTITPRLFTALFPTDAPVDVHVEGDAPEEQGIRIKGIIKHHFRVADVQGEVLPSLTQCTLFGTGYLEGGAWLVKKGYQHATDPNTGEVRRYFVPIEARPDCKAINYFEMFPHPAKRRVGDGLPIIRRRFIDGETLKALADSRFDIAKLAEALESKPEGTTGSPNQEINPEKEKEYEVLEYWGPWDEEVIMDGKPLVRKAVPWWGIVINRKVAIRSITNPFNHQMEPYCKFKLFEDPKPSWFGVGIGQIGQPTQERINKLVNQRLDNVDLVLNRMGIYNGNDNLINHKKLMVSKPGLFHKVSDINNIKWMDMPDVTQSSYEEEKIAKQDFREATGAVANLMPEIGQEHRTAMGIQLLQGAAGMRFRPVLRKMEIDLIQQLAMFFFSNLKQFMSEPEWVEITGKQGEMKPIKITPEEIQAKVFFIPTGISETLDKETQVGQLLRFKEVTAQDPTINRQEINRRIAELFGFKDINKLLTPPQQGGQKPGGLSPQEERGIQQRLAEGATPEQIKQEMLGTPPAQQEPGAPQGAPQ